MKGSILILQRSILHSRQLNGIRVKILCSNVFSIEKLDALNDQTPMKKPHIARSIIVFSWRFFYFLSPSLFLCRANKRAKHQLSKQYEQMVDSYLTLNLTWNQRKRALFLLMLWLVIVSPSSPSTNAMWTNCSRCKRHPTANNRNKEYTNQRRFV